MNSYWYNKLLDVLRVQTNSENEKLMVLFLDREIKKLKLDYTIDAAGNIIVTKGNAKTYPCVVSHMDTVHDFVDDFEIYSDIDDKDILFAMSNNKRVGIGGDDKCGIFGCLYLLATVPNIKVVFFSHEEVGCKGSTSINKKFFKNCRYIIQLDRKGKKDFIQTYWNSKTVSHEFSSEIGLIKKKYKYKNATGTVTDVMKLWYNGVGISCVNLSCGYYNPHSAYENISINDLWHSVKFVEETVFTIQSKKYPSLPPSPVIVTTPTYKTYQSKYTTCNICHQWKKEVLLYVLNSDYGKNHGKKVCYSCKEQLKVNPKKGKNKKNGNNKILILACHECGLKPINMKNEDSLKRINGDLYCDNCAAVLFPSHKAPKVCYLCNKIIPKDHKIIERYSIQICEDCALPSDTIKDD